MVDITVRHSFTSGIADESDTSLVRPSDWNADHIVTNGTGLAPLANPTLTGTPLAPTAAVDTNTTQIATTAFVIAQAGTATPIIDGTGAAGSSSRYSRQDHVHPTDTSRAPLASPTFTGTPAAPTASPGTNTTQIATTAFVATSFAPLASPALTGTPTAPTAANGTNTTQIASTAFVQTALGSAGGATQPQGRITGTSGTPVTESDVTGGTSIFYTPAFGRKVPIYDGSSFVMTDIGGELTNVLANSSTGKAGPAAAAADKNYFLLVWNDSGAIRFTRSPAWSSDTAPGTGAGTAEAEQVLGWWVNKVDITNGPAAQRGTIVGGFRTDGSAQVVDSFLKRYISNLYNDVERPMRAIDTTNTWTYNSSTFRQANASTANEFAWFHAFAGRPVHVHVTGVASSGTTNDFASNNIGIDSTTTGVTGAIIQCEAVANVNALVMSSAIYDGFAGVGKHRAVWLEAVVAAGSMTFYGDANGVYIQSGISGFTSN